MKKLIRRKQNKAPSAIDTGKQLGQDGQTTGTDFSSGRTYAKRNKASRFISSSRNALPDSGLEQPGEVQVPKAGSERKARQRLASIREEVGSPGVSSSHIVKLEKGSGRKEMLCQPEFVNLTHKLPTDWVVADVQLWLQYLDLSRYAENFRAQSISGAELLGFDENDNGKRDNNNERMLNAVGIKAIGHKKRFLRALKQLKEDNAFAPHHHPQEGGSSEGSNSEISSVCSSACFSPRTSSCLSPRTPLANEEYTTELLRLCEELMKNKVAIKCINCKASGEDDIIMIRVQEDISFGELKQLLAEQLGLSASELSVRYEDEEKDLVRIKNAEEFDDLMQKNIERGRRNPFYGYALKIQVQV
ncbi:hypothetical protein QOT17_020530 [Balamuthia mandrillaris]